MKADKTKTAPAARHWCPSCGGEVQRTGKRGAPQVYCPHPDVVAALAAGRKLAKKPKSNCQLFALHVAQSSKFADLIRENAPSATRGKAIHRMRDALATAARECDGVAR